MKTLQDISVQYIKGVGPQKKKLFSRLGVETIEDLLYFFPRRYEDRRTLTPIAQATLGDFQSVSGVIVHVAARRSWYTKKHVTEIVIDDKSGRLSCTWFNQPYLINYFKQGRQVVCFGRIGRYKNLLQMVSPEYEVIEDGDDESLSVSRIVPIYPLTRGITQRFLRKIIKNCLDTYAQDMVDELPIPVRNAHRLANIKRSIRAAHFPDDFEQQEESLRRISFEEFFFFQVSIILRRLSITLKDGIAHEISDSQALGFINGFPFTLTAAQKRVIREIRIDMQKKTPMVRLLQGDVGSGKTVVALFGCAMAHKNGYQSCIMAPTEILARQHYKNVTTCIERGLFKGMRAALLVSGLKAQEHDEICQRIADGTIDLVVGTHALINQQVAFKKLSFAVIDEQHKFGVRQRALLAEKGTNPDVLIMTATPIPRTLCITLYGDLDVSVIDEMPSGRGIVTTTQYSDDDAATAYARVADEVRAGRQAYIVYPIIEESETVDLKAAQAMYSHFKKHEFKDFRVGLIHGQMKQSDAQQVMEAFVGRQLDILIATTVIEVGVDVPNASVMVVEHAERFGLSQLHQLRGRIGRGANDALFLLIAQPETPEAVERLNAIVSTTDGFKIAQHDLLIRGPGKFFGRHQHGLNELKVADPVTQLDILELARKEAVALTSDDPHLVKKEHQRVASVIAKRYPTYLVDVKAG